MPMRRRARPNSRPPSVVISMSLRVTVPAVGSTSRLMQRMTVDLPAPEGPISAITWPSGTSRSMPFSARSPVRYRFTRPLMRSICPPTCRDELLASVLDPGRLVDLAQNRPILLVFDRNELAFLFELGRERRTLPRKLKERLLDLLDQLRLEVVGIAVAAGRE